MTESIDFPRRLAAHWPPAGWQGVSVLVAVSGGADSVALLRALADLKAVSGGAGRLLVAHFNHRLRGDESDADQQFVAALSEQLGLHCALGAAESVVASTGDGLESAARTARYDFLHCTARQFGARYVATAHTADDQVETILHRILRGTGLAGMAGIPRARPLDESVTLIRPLLEVPRADVEAYLQAIGQPYRDDSTNAQLHFLRNRIRHELLPLLERDYAAGVRAALLRLGALAGDAQHVIEAAAQELLDAATLSHTPNQITLDRQQLAAADRHLVRELFVLAWRAQDWPLQAMGYRQWNELAELAQSPAAGAARKIFPGNIVVSVCEAAKLRLERG